jgi:hypothetical protein
MFLTHYHKFNKNTKMTKESTKKALQDRTFLITESQIRYTSEEGERVDLRIGPIFQRAYPRPEKSGRGALFRVYGGNYEFLRGQQIYDTLSNDFAQEQLREAARNKVDAETFRQTIDDLLDAATLTASASETAA